MTDAQFRAQSSPSRRPGPPILPPLSKFYCGPAQGWSSTEASPSHNGKDSASSWSLIDPQRETKPKLPLRPSFDPHASPSGHWQRHSVEPREESQGWQSFPPLEPGPSTGDFAGAFSSAPGINHSPANTGWDSLPTSSSLDTATWGVSNKRRELAGGGVGAEPTLRAALQPLSTDQVISPRQTSLKRLSPSSNTSPQHFSARGSATTIDVPLFLQPQAFDPENAPPLPERSMTPVKSYRSPSRSPPHGQALPPWLTKIPKSQDNQTHDPRRPKFDPHNSFDLGHSKQDSQSSLGSAGSWKGPRFDPQNSHERSRNILLQTGDGVDPKISTPPPPSPYLQNRQGSVSPVQEHERWLANKAPNRWNSPAGYAPSPEFQHPTIPPYDGRSTSATDASSNLPAASTPESHGTSNTSYKEGYKAIVAHGGYEEECNDSFYWHSGRSSSEGENGQGESVTAGDLKSTREDRTLHTGSGYNSGSTARGNRFATSATTVRRSRDTSKGIQWSQRERTQFAAEYVARALPTRSSSLSPNLAVSYSASALGFGGPSDWEYFGDYEAEEIDDEELYAHKPRAELPADYLPPETSGSAMPEAANPQSSAEDRTALPDPSVKEKKEHRDEHEQTPPSSDLTVDEIPVLESKWSPSTTTPTTPHTNSSRPITVTSEPLPNEDHRSDLDEVIRAWSDSPYVGRASDLDSGHRAQPQSAGNPDANTEASFTSNPGEKVLGTYANPKDAPPLPKIPDSIALEDSASKYASSSILSPSDAIQQLDVGQDDNGKDPSTVLPRHNDGVTIPLIPTNTDRKTSNLASSKPEALAGSPSIISSHQSMDKQSISADVSGTGIANTGSPVSLFARKRQLFESPCEKNASPLPPQGKPVRTLNQSTSNLSLTDEKNVGARGLLDHPDVFRSQPASTDESMQISEKGSPSRMPSIDKVQQTLVEIPQPRSSLLSETKDKGLSAPAEGSASVNCLLPEASLDEAKVPSTSDGQNGPLEAETETFMKADTRKVTNSGGPPTSAVVQANAEVKEDRVIKESSQSNRSSRQSASEFKVSEGQSQSNDAINESQHQCRKPAQETRSSKTEAARDPYGDLDPWARASLNRFAAMLREEARAENNKDRLNIFNVFTTRESRLRVVLYGSDEELIVSQNMSTKPTKGPQRAQFIKPNHLAKIGSVEKKAKRSNTLSKQERTGKDLPPLPPNRDSAVGPPVSKLATSAVSTDKHAQPALETANNSLNSLEYSPGGRPSVPQHSRNSLDTKPQRDKGQGQKEEISIECAGAVLDATALTATTQAPAGDEGVPASRRTAHDKAKFSESGGEVKNYLTNRRSIYRPFATQTAESMEHAENFGRELEFPSDQPLMPLSMNMKAENMRNGAQHDRTISGDDRSLDLRRFVETDFDPLVMVLPRNKVDLVESPRLTELKTAMDAVPDDFSFIHGSVVSWDTKVKKQREVYERERHTRQMESEQRIDALFDDHEIGYGDIAELEGEFKKTEAARKTEEDRWEYQTFVEDVFNLVWTRLNYEMDQLRPYYERYSKLMNETLAGKDMFESSEGLALAPTMNAFLGLHQKLEIRHQKAFEAVLERDRRLKKTEISPWYNLSNIDKVKHLERQFEDAEKQAIIGYCEQRDARANQLMDVLDQNTLRGVGANQDYMEAIMKAVRRIASGRAFASLPSADGPRLGIEMVEKAKAIRSLLANSSEQIVQTFHVADMLLNNADYEVALAKAKVAKADVGTLARLKEERSKEDQKLMRDLEHRLALIREGSRRTNDEIIKLMLFSGCQKGNTLDAHSAPALGVQQYQGQKQEHDQQVTAGASDSEHEE